MPEPLKNRYTAEYIGRVADSLVDKHPQFDHTGFVQEVLAKGWEGLELKDRMRRITRTLAQYLPRDYPDALPALVDASRDFDGFEAMFFPQYVEFYGLDYFDLSMSALEVMTRFSSAEFAVRPFIGRYPERMMHQMLAWSVSDDFHLRRLASEGCRPRLPWAMALPQFKRNPAPIVPILENLCNDESDYVYRSVANNLNDISKDHPERVLDIARRWQGRSKTTDWVIKHACRSLLKQGNPEALKLFGFEQPTHILVGEFKVQPEVQMGGELAFEFSLHTESAIGRCRLEYRLHFLKANGSLSAKIFKISESDIREPNRSFRKRHSFRPISTRVHYPGRHELDIVVNGHVLASNEFELTA